MIRILVADKLAAEGLERLQHFPEIEFEKRLGLTPEELAASVGEFSGMLIRSGVKITQECLAKPGQLRAIARAGVGVDNVDLEAATAAGVLVMNTPDANTISTAEHTLAMLFALMRRIPDAHAHVRSGEWNRSAYLGRQLAGKTLGIIGAGRVGRAVAQRALACDMRVIGYDPFVGADSLFDGDMKLYGDLNDLLTEVDCLTLHAKSSGDTKHMIGAEQLAKMKPTAVLVNCARGELVDEEALAKALNDERIAGAAIDVYSSEPPEGNPLLVARNIVLSPHLGASTAEAQRAVSVEAVDALVDYLLRGEIRSAVNVVGMPAQFSVRDRAYLDLTDRMGTMLSSWCAGGVSEICVTVLGEQIQHLGMTLARQCVSSVLGPHVDTRVNLVNAGAVAAEREIKVDTVTRDASDNRTDVVHLAVQTREGRHEIEGTLFADGRPRILSLDGYGMEIVPERPIVLIFNDDRPGVIGLVGSVFGEKGINIADMTLSRRERTALMLLKLDEEADDDLLEELRAADPIISVRSVRLPPANT